MGGVRTLGYCWIDQDAQFLYREKKMRFSISTIIGIILGVSTFMFFVSNVRPVGWFDSLVGMILGVVVFIVVKNFKGFK